MHNVKIVLLAEEAPNNSNILDDDHERNRAESAQNAAGEAEEAETAEAERPDGPNEVEVEIDGPNEADYEVERLPDRYGIESREPHVRRG